MKARRTSREPDCHILAERLSAYLDGDLPTAACASIRRHAKSCRRCAALIDDLQKTAGLCRRAGTRPLPLSVRARAKARIRALLVKPR
jgi:anti-sigma factor RsiW